MVKNLSLAMFLCGAALTLPSGALAQTAARPAPRELNADGTPSFIRLDAESRYAASDAPRALREQLGLRTDDALRLVKTETDELGFSHEKFQQYYKGIKVEHGTYTAHSKQGEVQSLSGEFKALPTTLPTTATVSAAAALQAAMTTIGARRYMWQDAQEEAGLRQRENNPAATYRPQGELVIVNTPAGQPVLAWKFNIYAQQPISRAWVYVDAHTGQVVLQDHIIKHVGATSSFATAYSGTRALATETATGGYRLHEYTRGLGIETYNCRKGNSYTAAVDFIDADNNWTAAEYNNTNFDNVAGDAHFGAQATYDYWKNVHTRNSYDNAGAKIKSYVHFDDTPGDGVGFENAYWDGVEMTYGDGASTFKPLAALDVCGHEIGHAVCEKTANLTYANESGGMNEGLSDIWGACIEQYTCAALGLTKSTYLIGEDIMKAGGALRSMSNPNQYSQPAYYKGTYWVPSTTTPNNANDQGGVHTNSGVLNYWFYLVSNGKTGTNEKNVSFSVTGIGLLDAAKITFRMESVYMTAGSTYAQARTWSIQAATDLFGATSAQAQAVTNAWFAVGIGAAYSTPSAYCTSAGSSVAYEYLALVGLGSINRTSGADGGYYDGTALSTSVAQGSAQTVSYKAGFVSTAYTENVKVYIDWNKNNVFTDAGEMVASGTTSTTTTQTASFTVPATATVGTTRMRVVLSDNAATTSCGSYSYGETEDYSIVVTASGSTCGVPTGLASSSISSSGATATWTAVTGATSYNVQYRVTGGTTWTSTTSTTNSKALTGLAASTSYEFQVQTVCSGGSSAFSASASFTTSAATLTYCVSKGTSQAYEYISLVQLGSINRTSGADGGYYNGTALSTGVAAGSSQTITYQTGFTGTAYAEYFRIYADWNQNGVFTDAGENLVSSTNTAAVTTTRSATFTVPTTARNGAVRLRVVMSDNSATNNCGTYSYGETEDYTLNVTGGTIRLTGNSTTTKLATLTLYPNPATDMLQLNLTNGAELQSVQVLDVRGARVDGARYDGNGQLNVNGLPNGLYTVLVSDGVKAYTQRFIKQ